MCSQAGACPLHQECLNCAYKAQLHHSGRWLGQHKEVRWPTEAASTVAQLSGEAPADFVLGGRGRGEQQKDEMGCRKQEEAGPWASQIRERILIPIPDSLSPDPSHSDLHQLLCWCRSEQPYGGGCNLLQTSNASYPAPSSHLFQTHAGQPNPVQVRIGLCVSSQICIYITYVESPIFSPFLPSSGPRTNLCACNSLPVTFVLGKLRTGAHTP